MDIENIKQKVKEYFEHRKEIKLVYVFGSVVSGKAGKLSDIDIAVLAEDSYLKNDKKPYGYKADVLTDLIGVLKTNNVDLVLLNEASSLLRHRIICRGQLLLSRDDSEKIRLQVKAVNEYQDLKYLISKHLR